MCAIVNKSVQCDELFTSKISGICDVCGKDTSYVLSVMLPTFVNIFLNNYSKLCNDNIRAKGGKKRKLKTLTG
jgi:hypothetical protein